MFHKSESSETRLKKQMFDKIVTSPNETVGTGFEGREIGHDRLILFLNLMIIYVA
jgi:hypothetical protein